MWITDRKTGRILDVDGVLEPQDQLAAATRHDAEHGNPRHWVPLPPAWVPERLMPKVPLTDKIISAYKAKGYVFDSEMGGVRHRAPKDNARKQD
jgi:hypothetical protein